MRRRDFTALVGGAAVMWPLAARAQQRAAPLVGIVTISDRQTTLQGIWYGPFFQRLSDLGWTPGRNISIEYRFADNTPNQLPALVNDLVRLGPDAIYVPTRPALLAVKAATATIPIVFVSLGDPVFEGWVSSLARPGGNLTGVAGLSPELAGKRLELLREITPTLAKVAILHNPTNPSEEVAIRATETAAHDLGLSVFVEPVSDPGEFDRAISALVRNGAESIIVMPDPLFNDHRAELVQLIGQARIPAIYTETGFAAAGGLISYGPNLEEMFRRSADYLDKILRGAKPADLPVEQSTRFELIVNLRTAETLGIAIPPLILARAFEVIE
jgi:putative tryptophan/tyrosine transport system substrate-binding protein